MKNKAKVRVIECPTKRAVRLPDGDGGTCLYYLPEDHRQDVLVGDAVDVTWTEGDQFAYVLDNPRFVSLMPSSIEKFPDLPEPKGGEYVLWDRQEKKPVWTLSGDYAQAICLELKGGPFGHLENWFNEVSNTALDSEGIVPTKPPFTSNGL